MLVSKTQNRDMMAIAGVRALRPPARLKTCSPHDDALDHLFLLQACYIYSGFSIYSRKKDCD